MGLLKYRYIYLQATSSLLKILPSQFLNSEPSLVHAISCDCMDWITEVEPVPDRSNIIFTSVLDVSRTKMTSTTVFESHNVRNVVVGPMNTVQTCQRHHCRILMLKFAIENVHSGHVCLHVVNIHYGETIYIEPNGIF